MRTSRTRRRVAGVAVGLLVATLGAGCEPAPDVDAGGPTTTTSTSAPTTSVPTTTTVATTTTSSTTTSSTTTTTVAPDPDPSGDTDLTLRDTGLSRVRVTLSNEAEWVYIDLLDTTIQQSRIVSTSGGLRVTAVGGSHLAASGVGQAVVDLVLAVPAGTSPVLAMCKNYLGDATATVDRTTGDPTRIATLVNDGRSFIVLPGSCENRRVLPIAREDLIGPERWPARHDPRPLVLANYYPWYDPATLSTPFGDQPVGPADTSDPTQVAAAVDLARSSGVDGFVVEYEASPVHDEKIQLVWDAADARPGFQMATMLDFAILAYRGSGLDAAGLDAALGAAARHAGRPSQLEVGGRPVVFLYGSERVNPSTWSAALARLRDRTGLLPFIVNEGSALPSQGQYAYGSHQMPDEAALRRWSDDLRSRMHEVPAISGSAGQLWVAPVSPGYDDSRLRTPATKVDRAGGTRYEQAWDAALATLPDWIMVTSWNEYYEQTHVMPGSTTGMRALDQTRARSGRFHVTG